MSYRLRPASDGGFYFLSGDGHPTDDELEATARFREKKMLGWWITVSTLPAELEDSAMSKEEHAQYLLAMWETGIGGTGWLEALVADGKATWDKSKGGYPWRFMVKASDVLPVLTDGLPKYAGIDVLGMDEGEEYFTPAGWSSQVDLRRENIARCPPDAMLTIDAWDQS